MTRNYDFEFSDKAIHELAAAILLSREDSEVVLAQGEYSYKIKGDGDGYLYYRKGNRDWVLIANWCFYGLYIVVRYRKPMWLRPMYESLFRQMNFVSILFGEHSIEAVTTSGGIMRSRRFRLSPPFALEEVVTKKFGYSLEKIETLKAELNW
ncbi:MAG TPA: hypothetical protein VJ441_02585 [Dehalococcoidia bacterium]|nr:hypothetical protein [Dehalococcoidia bacterium]